MDISVVENVKKHSALTQLSGNRMTTVQRKLYTALIFSARETKILDNTATRYYIRYSELRRLAGITSPNNNFLHAHLEDMMSMVVRGNALGKDKSTRWSAFPILSGAEEQDDHYLMYSLPPQVDDVLLSPNVYAVINLSVVRKLQSKYSVSVYELVCDYRNVGTGFVELATLRDILGVSDKEYAQFKDFNKYVIKRSISEIEKAGGGKISVSYLKNEGTVTHIKFTFIQEEEVSGNGCIVLEKDIVAIQKEGGELDFDINSSMVEKNNNDSKDGVKITNDIVSNFKQKKLGDFISVSDGNNIVKAQVVAVTESIKDKDKAILVLNIDGVNIVEETPIDNLKNLI